MPQLAEYVNRENIQPTDRGTEALAQQGRRIGVAFNQVAESMRDVGNRTAQNLSGAIRDAGNAASDYVTHREISQGVATYAQLQDTLTNQWNDIAKSADPNDPAVRQRFIEGTLTPALQKWGDSFGTEGGQKWAQSRTAALLDHMYEKTAADMGTLAAQAVSNNLRTVGNTMANTAGHDPSSVDHLLDGVESSVGALVDSAPNLKGAAAGKAKTEISEKLKEGIVKQGAMAAIRMSSDPEKTADDWVRKYPQYITGDEAHALAQNARHEIRARDYDERTAAWYQKQEATAKSNDAVSQYLIDINNKDPRIVRDPVAQRILHDDNLTKADKEKMLGYIARQVKPETDTRVSAETTVGLLRKLRTSDADLDKLMDEAWKARLTDPGLKGSMTERDFNTVRNEILGRKTPEGADLSAARNEFFKQYARTIDPAMDTFGGHSQAGAQAQYLAEQDARRQEQVLRQKGIDPHELYDPRSPNFFGRPENLDKYRRTGSLQENLKALASERKGEVQYVTPPPFAPMVRSALPPDKTNATFRERFGGFDAAATVTTKADYDKLPSGAEFTSNGQRYRKP